MIATDPRVGGTLPPPPFYPEEFDGDRWRPGRWDWIIRLMFRVVHVGIGLTFTYLYWFKFMPWMGFGW